MDRNISVSVVIPTYNRAEKITRSIQSLLKQEIQPCEIIVVDDGSTDDTATRIKTFPKVKYIAQRHSGPAAARNNGVKHASSSHVLFLDSDDIMFPGGMAIVKQSLSQEPDVVAVIVTCVKFYEAPPIYPQYPTTPTIQQFPHVIEACEATNWCGIGHMTIQKEAFQQVGGLNEQLRNKEDTDLQLRLGSWGPAIVIAAPPIFAREMHSNSLINDRRDAATGLNYILRQERRGRYGISTSKRLQLLARDARNLSLECLRLGHIASGLGLYFQSLPLQCRDRRGRYLVGFPFLTMVAIAQLVTRLIRSTPS